MLACCKACCTRGAHSLPGVGQDGVLVSKRVKGGARCFGWLGLRRCELIARVPTGQLGSLHCACRVFMYAVWCRRQWSLLAPQNGMVVGTSTPPAAERHPSDVWHLPGSVRGMPRNFSFVHRSPLPPPVPTGAVSVSLGMHAPGSSCSAVFSVVSCLLDVLLLLQSRLLL